jgi:DnaK suppressor protein
MKPQKLNQLTQSLTKRRDALRNVLLTDRDLGHVTDRGLGDDVDTAVDREQEEMQSHLAAAESRELRDIENALARIRAGDYGICAVCGKRIPVIRLRAIPYATLCIKCQREDEQAYCQYATSMNAGRTDDENSPNGMKLEVI